MAKKPKKTPSYDLKAADRKRNLLIQIGLTAVVVIFAVALVLVIVVNAKDKPAAGEAKAVRVASSALVTKEGTTEPKVVLSLYEDFLCPVCARFEQQFGPTITNLVKSGAIAVDYHMVAILDRPANANYSSRAGAAAYCVADEDKTPEKEAFSRFHAALYAQQPDETGSSFPDNKALISTARLAGAGGSVSECINGGTYIDLVEGLAAAAGINSTPTIKINGEDFTLQNNSTPEDLVKKVTAITGELPGATAVAPATLPGAAQTGTAPGAGSTPGAAATPPAAAPSAVQPTQAPQAPASQAPQAPR